MGGWDPYCPLCGMQLCSPARNFLRVKDGPYTGPDWAADKTNTGMVWSLKKFHANPKKKTKIKGNKNIINYVEDNPIVQAPTDFCKIAKKAKWMKKITILLPNSKPQHGYIETKGSIGFTKTRSKDQDNIEHPGNGVVLHTECWKLANESKTLTFDCFNHKRCIVSDKYWSHYMFNYLNYHPVNQYQEQYFNIHKLATKPHHWYLMGSPLKDTPDSLKNRQRIEKNILKVIANIPKR